MHKYFYHKENFPHESGCIPESEIASPKSLVESDLSSIFVKLMQMEVNKKIFHMTKTKVAPSTHADSDQGISYLHSYLQDR